MEQCGCARDVTDRIRGEIDMLFDGSPDLVELIKDVARLGARLIIQTALEAEVEVFRGRARYPGSFAERLLIAKLGAAASVVSDCAVGA